MADGIFTAWTCHTLGPFILTEVLKRVFWLAGLSLSPSTLPGDPSLMTSSPVCLLSLPAVWMFFLPCSLLHSSTWHALSWHTAGTQQTLCVRPDGAPPCGGAASGLLTCQLSEIQCYLVWITKKSLGQKGKMEASGPRGHSAE